MWAWLVAALAVARADLSVPEFLTQPLFDVEFVSQVLPEQMEGTDAVRIETGWGAAYVCHIPQNATTTQGASTPITDSVTLDRAREVIRNESSTRAIRKEGFWAYELIPGKHVLQFEPGYNEVAMYFDPEKLNYVLGNYSGEPEPVLVDGKHMLRSHMPNGDICDLTGEPREIDVYWYCDPSSEHSIHVRTVVEMYICAYEMQVAVKGLCEIPEFMPVKPPSNIILCAMDGPLDPEVRGQVRAHGENTFPHYPILNDLSELLTALELDSTLLLQPEYSLDRLEELSLFLNNSENVETRYRLELDFVLAQRRELAAQMEIEEQPLSQSKSLNESNSSTPKDEETDLSNETAPTSSTALEAPSGEALNANEMHTKEEPEISTNTPDADTSGEPLPGVVDELHDENSITLDSPAEIPPTEQTTSYKPSEEREHSHDEL